MNQKPSERIKDINQKDIPFVIRDSDIGLIHAIIQYLDEQHEKEQRLFTVEPQRVTVEGITNL